MKMRYLLLLAPFALFGSVNEPMRWEWQSGYRNDNVHWHLQNPGDESELTYSEHYRNLQFWENALSIRVIYRDIALFLRGAGAFGSGPLKQRFSELNFTSEQPLLFFHTGAWSEDGWGYFGYAVNLTSDRTYKVILLPFIGAGLSYEHLDRSGSHTADGSAVGADTYALTSSFPSSERICRYGPLLGGLFLIQPGGRMQFEAGYAYRREHLRFKTKMQTAVALYDGASLVSETGKLETLKVKDGSNLSQSGWARIDFLISHVWRGGLFAQIQYFTSRVLNVTVKNKTTGAAAEQKYKARWTAVSGAISLSRTF